MVGQTISHYRILQTLGAGGMGMVYAAEDLHLQRIVAFKVLLPHTEDDEDARKLLMREARVASSLNHPNICTIHEVGESDGVVWIAMERVDGGPLSDRIGPAGLPLDSVLRYGIQIADALAHAHGRGVVHRDIKSSNILVTRDDRVKVSDFGLAKRVHAGGISSATVQRTGGPAAGTPHFLAPELLRGNSADARSDVWALGVLLHEMASGALPFTGRTEPELSAAILNSPPMPLPPRVPPGLATLVAGCLQKDPARRTADAVDVRLGLERVAAETISRTTPRPGAVTELHPARPRRRGGARMWIAAAAGVALLVAAACLALGEERLRSMFGLGRSDKIRSIAVLPLDNLSGDPSQQFFADGMTEDLITELAQIGGLRVISRTSVLRYKGTGKSVPEIGRELSVDAIVEGSVQRAEDQVRITAQLIRTDRDEHVWAARYQRDAKDVLALQSEVARAIAREVKARLTPPQQAQLAAAPPIDPATYELFLKGRAEFHRFTPDGSAAALKYFHRVLERDSTFAPAWAMLGQAYGNGGDMTLPRSVQVAHARRAIEKALVLDPNLALARASLGDLKFHVDWDWEGAAREYERAIALNPNNGESHFQYAHYLLMLGRTDAALEHARAALAIDPHSPALYAFMGGVHLVTERYDDALDQFRKALAMDPDFTGAYIGLAQAYLFKGDFDRALAEYRQGVALGGSIEDTTVVIAMAEAYVGRKASARHKLETFLQGHPDESRFGNRYMIAAAYALLGEPDAAFAWLEKAFRDRDESLVGLRTDPFWKSLRSDPRYADLLRRMKLPA